MTERRYLVDAAGGLPEVVRESESIWAAATRDARERGAGDTELLGWAGDRHVGSRQSALLLRAATGEDSALATRNCFVPVNRLLTGKDAQFVRTALEALD